MPTGPDDTELPRSVAVTESGPVAVGGNVTITGAVAAGRDVIIERLTVQADDGAPFGDAATRPEDAADVCPYPGIQAFGEEQRSFLFGRDRDRRAVLDMLERADFVAVVGASGSGKSSMIAAGVGPDFVEARRSIGEEWQVVSQRPGARPAEQLARHLDGRRGRSAPVLWVIDQLEEVFARHVDVVERDRFLDALADIAAHVHGRAKVLVSMRSDFYPSLDLHRRTADAIAAHQHRLLPLDADALRDVVVLPAERVGLRVEPALIGHVLDDVEPGAIQLPLLAYAMRETWRRRRNGWLTLAGYVEAGGVNEALENGARAVWQGLSPPQRATTQRIFLRLTATGEGRAATKRRAAVESLVTDIDELDAVVDVLERFTRQRLVVPDQDDAGRPTVDIAHEALLREWSVLRGWLEDDDEARRLQRELADAAQVWHRDGREATGLLGGRRLQAVLEAHRARQLTVNETEQAFLDASSGRATRDRRRSVLLVALPAVLVAALAVVALVVVQQRQTSEQKTVADALALAAEARSLTTGRRDTAALLAVAALRTDENPTTLGTLIDAVMRPDGPLAYLTLADAQAVDIAATFDANGAVVVGASDGSVRFVSPTTGTEVERVELGLGSVSAVGVAADGTVVAGAADGRVAMMRPGAASPVVLSGPTMSIVAVAYDDSANVAAAATAAGAIWRWRIEAEVAALPTIELDAGLFDLALVAPSEGGAPSELVAATGAGELVRLDVASGQRRSAIENAFAGGSGVSLTALPSGELLVVDSSRIARWNLDTGAINNASDQVPGSSAIAVVPSGDVALTGTESGEIQAWTLDPRPIPIGPGRSGLVGRISAIATDGTTVVALDRSGRLVAWDVAGRRPPGARLLVEHDNGVLAVAHGPDGVVASGDRNGVVRLTPPGGESRVLVDLDAPVRGVAWLGRAELVIGAQDGSVQVVDTASGRSRPLASAPGPAIVGVASGGDDAVAYADEDGLVTVIDGGRTVTLQAPSTPIESLALAADGGAVAVGSGRPGSDVSLWDLGGGPAQPVLLRGHALQVTSLAFSPSGDVLASGSDDQEIRLWSVPGGDERGLLTGHTDMVQSLAFGPNGQMLVSGSEDFSVRVWDVAQQRQVGQPWTWAQGPIWALAVAADGRSVAAGNATSLVEWAFGERGWTERACSLARRDLGPAEWEERAPGRTAIELCPDEQ